MIPENPAGDAGASLLNPDFPYVTATLLNQIALFQTILSGAENPSEFQGQQPHHGNLTILATSVGQSLRPYLPREVESVGGLGNRLW